MSTVAGRPRVSTQWSGRSGRWDWARIGRNHAGMPVLPDHMDVIDAANAEATNVASQYAGHRVLGDYTGNGPLFNLQG